MKKILPFFMIFILLFNIVSASEYYYEDNETGFVKIKIRDSLWDKISGFFTQQAISPEGKTSFKQGDLINVGVITKIPKTDSNGKTITKSDVAVFKVVITKPKGQSTIILSPQQVALYGQNNMVETSFTADQTGNYLVYYFVQGYNGEVFAKEGFQIEVKGAFSVGCTKLQEVTEWKVKENINNGKVYQKDKITYNSATCKQESVSAYQTKTECDSGYVVSGTDSYFSDGSKTCEKVKEIIKDKWKIENNICKFSTSGYDSLQECEKALIVGKTATKTWDVENNKCIEKDNVGEFISLQECESNLINTLSTTPVEEQKYDINLNNECVEVINGKYNSLENCKKDIKTEPIKEKEIILDETDETAFEKDLFDIDPKNLTKEQMLIGGFTLFIILLLIYEFKQKK